jgi:P27 family predicted phage terminase small subunit
VTGERGPVSQNVADVGFNADDIPDRPDFLTGEACEEWDRVVPALAELGLIAKTDRALLAVHAQTWADLQAVQGALGGEFTIVRPTGVVVVNPLYKVWESLLSTLLTVDKALGLTPASRLRLPAPPRPAANDPFDELLKRRRERERERDRKRLEGGGDGD